MCASLQTLSPCLGAVFQDLTLEVKICQSLSPTEFLASTLTVSMAEVVPWPMKNSEISISTVPYLVDLQGLE